VYSVRARRIGYQATTIDSVPVGAGVATVKTFTLSTATTQLEGVRITSSASASSDAALIALQRAAPAVMDGISSQTMARSPGANAAEAITRVTGVSIVDNKFTVVRGLPERYANTLLNGVDLPSPEPLRKIVPLDIFPSSLLESIITTKTATPDKPGDFAGGSVEIRTKEFPESRVIQLTLSQDWNSLTTFRPAAYVPHTGGAWLGFGGDGRDMPPRPASDVQGDPLERFAESIRNVWTPSPRRAPPGLGASLGVGDRVGDLGYTVSLTYLSKLAREPERLYQFIPDDSLGTADRGYIANETQSVVDWGGTANFTWLLAPSHKISLKNLYTRNAEETFSVREAFENTGGAFEQLRMYQARYVERDLVQTQLAGDHVIDRLWNARLEWKATAARARRNEPDNRSATYAGDVVTGLYSLQSSKPGYLWFRFLDDDVTTGQSDLSLPIRMWGGREMLLKTGGMYRRKQRSFAADVYTYRPSPTPPSGAQAFLLPPEQAFAPEHLGTLASGDIALARLDAQALPYRSLDNLVATYAMIDLPLFSRLRVVGGARAERWMLDVNPASGKPELDSVTQRRELDVLGSVNVTLSLTDRMIMRLAAYQTVARPDPRELTRDYYTPVTGECGNQGDDKLVHTKIKNADFRWEYYPGASEIFAVSGFYKRFDKPVIEILTLPQSSTCIASYKNAESAINYGAELEMRKTLGFLPLLSDALLASVNLTLVRTTATLGQQFGGTTQFQGQSPYVLNASLSYTTANDRLNASVLANSFGDRITRYGATLTSSDGRPIPIPHVWEEGRTTVDAKVQVRVRSRVTVSLAAKNLTDASQRSYQETKAAGRVLTGFVRPGTSLKLGTGLDF
jgi:TonB-dependent receptor